MFLVANDAVNVQLIRQDSLYSPASNGPVKSTRVLLVDDDPAYRQLCKRFLAADSSTNFEVVEVGTGPDAIECCRNHKFDCFLIDYSLPHMSGTQLLRSLERLCDNAPPAIIMTAGGGEVAAAESVRAGAADYLPKRYVSAESLGRAIGNATEKWQLRMSVHNGHRDLELANQQLKIKNTEINRFYHNVSHEVKTPLTAIREFIAIVADGLVGDVNAKQSDMLQHALDSCDQIASHFNDLIELTRLETGKLVLDKQRTSIEMVVTRCVVAAGPTIQAKFIAFDTEIPSVLPLVMMDANRIVQVLSNLVGNAVKFTESHGEIKVIVEYDDVNSEIEISVRDTGCGISLDDRQRIFDRLFQVVGKGDSVMGAGLGLGLTISRDIVRLHGGTMNVQSHEGVGSTFSFRLPINGLADNSSKEAQ